MATGKRRLYRIYLDNRYAAEEYATSQAAAVRAYKAREGEANLRNYRVQAKAYKSNPGRVTKAQCVTKARKAAVQRRVALALAKYLKQMNPAMKTAGAKVQRLKGGVIKITPIKANAGRLTKAQVQQMRLEMMERLRRGEKVSRAELDMLPLLKPPPLHRYPKGGHGSKR